MEGSEDLVDERGEGVEEGDVDPVGEDDHPEFGTAGEDAEGGEEGELGGCG